MSRVEIFPYPAEPLALELSYEYDAEVLEEGGERLILPLFVPSLSPFGIHKDGGTEAEGGDGAQRDQWGGFGGINGAVLQHFRVFRLDLPESFHSSCRLRFFYQTPA